MDQAIKIIIAILVGGIGYWWYRHRQFRTKADEFKELLAVDVAHYQSSDTTLSAVVLRLFPKHDEQFRKLLVYVPKRRRYWLLANWRVYEEVHECFRQFGVFGIVMAELPHPDFGTSPEAASLVERKRKIQVMNVFNDILEKALTSDCGPRACRMRSLP